MAKPTLAQVRPVANPVLTRMLVAFMNNSMDFVATRAAPVVTVDDESGTYITFDATYWFADQLERRAYGDAFAQAGYGLGSDTYKTLQWGLEHPIPVEHEASNQAAVSLRQLGITWLGTQSLIRKERSFSADFMVTGVWDTDNTGATDWDSTGTPIADVRTAKRTIRQGCGVAGNAAVMGEIVWDALHTNAQVLSMIQYTESLTTERREALLASVLGLDFVFVSKAIRNTANLAQADSLAAIIDDDCLITIVQPGADMMTVSGVKTFTWQPGGGQGVVNSYYSDERKSDILQHSEQWDQKLVSSAAGYFFSDIV